MNGDLISRSALWTYIMMLPHNGDIISSEEVEQAIVNAPAVDAEPVRHGRWIDRGDYITTAYGSLYMKVCSNCNAEVTLDGYDYYCPNCGAKMDAEVKE